MKRMALSILLGLAMAITLGATLCPYVTAPLVGSVGRPHPFTFYGVSSPVSATIQWGDSTVTETTIYTAPQAIYHTYSEPKTYIMTGQVGGSMVGALVMIKCVPPVASLPSVVYARTGEPLVLQAQQPVTVSLPYSISWLLDGAEISSSEVVTVTAEPGEHELAIVGITPCAANALYQTSQLRVSNYACWLPLVSR